MRELTSSATYTTLSGCLQAPDEPRQFLKPTEKRCQDQHRLGVSSQTEELMPLRSKMTVCGLNPRLSLVFPLRKRLRTAWVAKRATTGRELFCLHAFHGSARPDHHDVMPQVSPCLPAAAPNLGPPNSVRGGHFPSYSTCPWRELNFLSPQHLLALNMKQYSINKTLMQLVLLFWLPISVMCLYTCCLNAQFIFGL
jgi:hypothetical protein